jgi:spore coat polysaccharide biosynthesis predicted glycosyltransferase SpsG
VEVVGDVAMVLLSYETYIVVGAGWPHVERAKRMIGNHPRIHLYEDPSFFPQLLARADLALCGSGSTTYELAYLGIPMLTTALVPHQTAIAKGWESRGISDHLGPADILTPDLIMQKLLYWMEQDQELENRGIAAQKLVDGRGKFRVLERINKLIEHKREAALESA